MREAPETEAAVPNMQRIRAALRPVRGPVRFQDLTARGAPAIAGAEDPATDFPAERPVRMQVDACSSPPSSFQAAAPGQTPSHDDSQSPSQTVPHQAQTHGHDDSQSQSQTAQVPSQHTRNPRHSESRSPSQAATRRDHDQGRQAEDPRRERSRSPPRASPAGFSEAQLQEGINRARKLDGLPPIPIPAPKDEGETMDLSFEDDALLVASEVSERSMTEQEKKAFDVAKDEALLPWIKNVA